MANLHVEEEGKYMIATVQPDEADSRETSARIQDPRMEMQISGIPAGRSFRQVDRFTQHVTRP
jgi:hypothetical protein